MSNIADRLRESARNWPAQRAVVFPAGKDRLGRFTYSQFTFQQLDEETDRIASGLRRRGVARGHKIVLAVPPSLEFIALTFGVFRSGATLVLIDPGMGRRKIIDCLAELNPDGFIGIPRVHVARLVFRSRFPNARFNVCVGSSLFEKRSYQELIETAELPFEPDRTELTDMAAIIFTSGSTGPPKGVAYEHGMFQAQVDLLREFYGIKPGEIDLPGFPLFGLFNAAMGVTTVIPRMDPTRPADVEGAVIERIIRDQGVTQAFGSPAFWNTIGRYGASHRTKFPTLKRTLSAGGPVPNRVLEKVLNLLEGEESNIHTPYGATEALPVASISGREVLSKTALLTDQGAGTCVGVPFPRIDVRIIKPVEGAITSFAAAEPLPSGEIGEIVVRGPSVTREYFEKPEATRLAKIPDGETFWHRMGDMGYLDDEGRLWFCGRKAHVVTTSEGPLYSVPCESIFNTHERVYRSALVGLGAGGGQTPVIIIEPEPGEFPETPAQRDELTSQLLELGAQHETTRRIERVLYHRGLPVDPRHNVKIDRELLARWAVGRS